jgi:hypothetical protein
MGLEIIVFGEVSKGDRWRPFSLRQGSIANGVDHEADIPATNPPCIYWSTNRALLAIFGGIRKTYCSVGEFEQLPVSSGLPTDCSPEIADWMSDESSLEDQKGWIGLEDVLRFPFSEKKIVREAYVPKEMAPLFGSPSALFPYDRWPSTVAISYSSMSRHGILVQWTETYAESIGEDFLQVLQKVNTIEPTLPKRFIFAID